MVEEPEDMVMELIQIKRILVQAEAEAVILQYRTESFSSYRQVEVEVMPLVQQVLVVLEEVLLVKKEKM